VSGLARTGCGSGRTIVFPFIREFPLARSRGGFGGFGSEVAVDIGGLKGSVRVDLKETGFDIFALPKFLFFEMVPIVGSSCFFGWLFF